MRRVTALMLMTMAAVTALGFFMGSAGGNSSGATGQATPKPNNGGSLSGIYDALVSPHDLSGSEDGAGADSCSDTFDNGGDTLADVADPDCRDKSIGLFHCIVRLDHDGTSDETKAAAVCYVDTPGLDLGSAIPDRADLLPGPPPPPPYTTAAPTKLDGVYEPGTDTLTLGGCFANVGSSLGPNVILEATFPSAKASLGNLRGTVAIYENQSNVRCAAGTPSGPTPDPEPLNLTLATPDRDFDGDGCSDLDELAKPAPASGCGDDPYNPHDSDTTFDSVGNLLMTLSRADYDDVAGQPIPGGYFHCITDSQHDTDTNDLTMRLMCYVDNPLITVNPENVPGADLTNDNDGTPDEDDTCGPAPAAQCGDGLPGSPPPLPFGDIDTMHTEMTGIYDTLNDELRFEGCFPSVENELLGPSIYSRTTVDARTGQGEARIWLRQDPTDCQAGNPLHTKETETGLFGPRQIDCGEIPDQQNPQPCPIEVVEQAPRGADWDSDLDYCPDDVELGTSQLIGGLRDPYNRYDWFDQYTGVPLAKDGSIVANDISALVARFGTIGSLDGDINETPLEISGYHISADRSGSVIGSNSWNLRQPDGTIVANDISALVAQFGHTGCNTS